MDIVHVINNVEMLDEVYIYIQFMFSMVAKYIQI